LQDGLRLLVRRPDLGGAVHARMGSYLRAHPLRGQADAAPRVIAHHLLESLPAGDPVLIGEVALVMEGYTDPGWISLGKAFRERYRWDGWGRHWGGNPGRSGS
jgi:hypothetical protein